MQYPLLSEYVGAITQASENLDQLKHLEVVQDEHGEPYRSSGAFAVVFKMRDPHTERFYALKCFTDEQIERAEAYRKIEEELEMVGGSYFTSMCYYERELFVDSSVSSDSEFPVLLMDWVEGETMDLYIREHYQDSYAMAMLCYRFCRLATYLRSQPFAHGDVKPDNIIVSPRGALTLIDYDGMFVPVMAGDSSPTLGTEEFRHPLRTAELFDATIDDFALASIALSLRAIALEPKLFEQFGAPDRLLFSASDYLDLAQSSVMQAIWSLTSDRDLSKLVALFVLAHAEQSLAATSFQLFAISRPEKPALLAPPSTKVTDEDLAEAYTDEYGVKFSPDRKRLLKADTSIASYTIPESVTAIGDSAFSSCSSLTQITIPESVYNIGENPFAGLKIELKNLSPHFLVEDNVLFTADKKRLISYCSTQTSYCIPNSVTTIGNWTFNKCSSLSQITIPESVTSIGDSAFSGCDSLTQITIPESVTAIGDKAFDECYSLTQITIPESVYNIGENPFAGLKIELKNLSPHFLVEDNVLFTADKKRLISYCSTQTSYCIPNSVTAIGDSAFSWCYSLTQITIPESVTAIGNSAFSGCDSLTQITIPESVTAIGDEAFCYCDSLTQIIIPNSVTSIGDEAFSGCRSLSQITIPSSVTSIGDKAFSECHSLTQITIPSSVTAIGDEAFSRCDSLSQITIPNSVTAIGNSAFSGCDSLTQITIPSSVTDIGDEAFSECRSLSQITIPESVTAIGNSAFSGCRSLSQITIPESVTSIGGLAFLGCSSLTQITIPESVTSIGGFAFLGCSSLIQITIPSSVTDIGNGAFSGCRSLSQITIPESVTSIGGWTFAECSSLPQITIPESVTSIGNWTFNKCTSLTQITIPSSVTSIGDKAFSGCSSLESPIREKLREKFGGRIF